MSSKLKALMTGAAVAVVIGAGQAGAASVACDTLSPNVTDLVTPNYGCEALTSADNDSAAAVSGMFAETDWAQIAKVEGFPGTDSPLSILGDEEGGSWSVLASVFDMYEKVMLVFKGGDRALPEAVVGYLIKDTSGTYTSPFYDVQGGRGPNAGQFKIKDISHVSLYAADRVSAVPVPAGLPLLMSALGLGAMLRRRTSAKS